MIDLCIELSSINLYWWQQLIIDTEMVYVILNSQSLIEFEQAICNLDFIDLELSRISK